MVYVVLWNNYGDQGSDYLGVFSTREKAEKFTREHMEMIDKKLSRKPNEHELQDYNIIESEVK